ncbi:hypothetical protein J4439_02475 [Candidatus Woesearchaeota archaeon]|nr:hypothetical protein [Candidatus Woesearchaeota archaeon]
MEFELRPCKSKAALEAVPSAQVRLDFGRIAARYSPLARTPQVLVLSVDAVQVVVHRFGKLTFRDCAERRAREIATRLYAEAGL